MKKSLIGMMASVLLLSGCATTDGNLLTDVGKSIFIQAVDNKCRSELNAQPLYQSMSILMTTEQKRSFEDNTCGCVAKEAPNSVTLEELATATIDSNARAQIALKAVNKSVMACANAYLSGFGRKS